MSDDKLGQCAHGYYGLCPHCYDSLRAELAELRARAGELERQVRDKHEAATVDEICNAYESGVGHRGRPTASVNPYRKGSDLATAYNIGALGDRESPAAAAVPEDVAKYRHHLELLRDDCTYPAGHVGAVVLNGHRMEIIRDALAAILAKIDASKGEVPLPLSALVCVGRARFPRTGGNAGISWHVEDALSDTGGFRSGNPCNGELLFVLPATAKRAMLAASGRQDGAR